MSAHLNQLLQLVEVHGHLRHVGLEDLSEFVSLHELDKHRKCIFLRELPATGVGGKGMSGR